MMSVYSTIRFQIYADSRTARSKMFCSSVFCASLAIHISYRQSSSVTRAIFQIRGVSVLCVCICQRNKNKLYVHAASVIVLIGIYRRTKKRTNAQYFHFFHSELCRLTSVHRSIVITISRAIPNCFPFGHLFVVQYYFFLLFLCRRFVLIRFVEFLMVLKCFLVNYLRAKSTNESNVITRSLQKDVTYFQRIYTCFYFY